MTTDSEDERKIYKIPEVREPTLHDYIAHHIVPELFRFTEYVTLAGFVLYLSLKTERMLLHAFAMMLYGCVLFYVMDKQIAFVQRLEFRNVWVMRVTSWMLVILGAIVTFSSLLLVLSIASAQNFK